MAAAADYHHLIIDYFDYCKRHKSLAPKNTLTLHHITYYNHGGNPRKQQHLRPPSPHSNLPPPNLRRLPLHNDHEFLSLPLGHYPHQRITRRGPNLL